MRPRALLWALLATLGVGTTLIGAGSGAIFTGQHQNTGNSFVAAALLNTDTPTPTPTSTATPTATFTPTPTPTPSGISFRAPASSAGAASGTLTLTISKPAATVQNDVMVASIGVRPNTATITPPSGWTLVRRIDNANPNANSLAVYVLVAGASEPASYSWTFSTSTGSAGGIQTFSGVDTTNPIDVENGQNTASGLTHSTPSITTTVANAMLVTSHTFTSAATWTPPSGMTEAFDVASVAVPSTTGQSTEGNYALQAAAGATGAKTATASNDADVGNTHILALRPAGAPTATPTSTPTPTATPTVTPTPTATATPTPTPTPCPAGNTGLLNASAQAADTGGDGNGFELNPTYAFADDSLYAENYNGAADRHRYYNYGVSIPAGCSSVSGIEVRLDWWMDSTFGTNSMSVELSWDGGTSWTAAKSDTVETTTQHTGTLGGAADTWGRAWTAAELGNGNFRVRVTSNSTSAFRDFFLEWIPVRVYYGP